MDLKTPHLLVLAAVLLASTPLYAECGAADDMLRIVTSNESPNLPEGSFARRPKIQYRAGTRYTRTEEALDSATNT